MRRSSSPAAWGRRASSILVLTIAHAAPAAGDAPTAATHCSSAERVQFSCQIRAKTVSLCASPDGAGISALTYRYGALSRVEFEFVAKPGSGRHFHGAVLPASPRALVRQVWFDQGQTRFLLTECAGGDCVARGGLAVLQGDKVAMRGFCSGTSDAQAWFSKELVSFGSDTSSSVAHTPLLILEDADNNVEQIYGTGARKRY